MKNNKESIWYLSPIFRYPLIVLFSLVIILFLYVNFGSANTTNEDFSTVILLCLLLGAPTFYLIFPTLFGKLTATISTLSNVLLKKVWNLVKPIVYFALLCLILFLGYKVLLAAYNYIRPKTWTLMICEGEPMYDGGCYNNSYVLEGYKSQRECMEKGLAMPNTSGFECGGDCRIDDTWGRVCQTLCNKSGCSK